MALLRRPYRDERDFDAMARLLMAGRRAGTRLSYVHPGDISWWLYYLMRDEARDKIITLWEDAATGRLAGWALFSLDWGAFDIFVHPELWGRPESEEMVLWTEQTLRELLGERGAPDMRTMWVFEQHHELIALLEPLGYQRGDYHMLVMQRALDAALPEPALPEGYSVRHVGDAADVERRARAGHAVFRPDSPLDEYLANYRAFAASPVYRPELDLIVIAPDGSCAAFGICWLDAESRTGLFEPVGTHPDQRGRGLGQALIHAGLQALRGQGMERAVVYPEFDNPAAQRLYASAGFVATQKIHTYERSLSED